MLTQERGLLNALTLFFDHEPESAPFHIIIHSKTEQIGGGLLLSTEKLAEKVRTSGRQYFGTKVR